MIPYHKSFIGVQLLFRFHGSPLYRSFAAGLISMLVFVLIRTQTNYSERAKSLQDPYIIEVLVGGSAALIVFRANYGYERYWNACGDVHQMMSGWLDAVAQTGVYHMLQSHHSEMMPPSYFDNHDLNRYGLSRDREIDRETFNNITFPIPSFDQVHPQDVRKRMPKRPSILPNGCSSEYQNEILRNHRESRSSVNDPKYLMSEGRLDGGWGAMFDDGKSTYFNMGKSDQTWNTFVEDKGFASDAGGRTPNLFLQELVHLASLCNAVAFCTLRDDVEGVKMPLRKYLPGEPWPAIDPYKSTDKRGTTERIRDALSYIVHAEHTPEKRTAHNASRPLPVLGGVSDTEYAFLERAKGPSAKVNLAANWLIEFIQREQLEGSLGEVGPPIISRIHQFLSDGMISYNHARKTMFIPFPLPHAQISAMFVLNIILAVPLLMVEHVEAIYTGAILTFLTITCLAGLHAVAKELENPFRNVPNEIPLVTLQAIFNEGLVSLFAGFHPDHYWDPDEYRNEAVSPPVPALVDNQILSEILSAPISRNSLGLSDEKLADEANVESLEHLYDLVLKQQEELDRLCSKVKSLEHFYDSVHKQQKELERLDSVISEVYIDQITDVPTPSTKFDALEPFADESGDEINK